MRAVLLFFFLLGPTFSALAQTRKPAFVAGFLGASLLNSDHAAVAVWASSGGTGPEGQRVLLDAFYRELFSGQSVTIGEAAARAKSAAAGDVRRSWVLLGDPATKLH